MTHTKHTRKYVSQAPQTCLGHLFRNRALVSNWGKGYTRSCDKNVDESAMIMEQFFVTCVLA